MADNGQMIHRVFAASIRIVASISSPFQLLYAALISSFEGQNSTAAFFPHKLFANAMFGILGFLQVVSQGMANSPFQSNPRIFTVAVSAFLIYCFAYAIERISYSSWCAYELPRSVTNSLRLCMFLASYLSFAATASLLFQESVRFVILVSLIFFILSVCALLSGGWRSCQQFFIKIWMWLASRFRQQPREILP